ncbi:MAG: DinB family protein [Jiangellales bacterium]
MTANDDGIVPDTKDWTWVLDEACSECGLDTRQVGRDDIGALVRANAAAWVEILARDDVALRPTPDVWSPLEYACHVRDVFRIFDERLALMLAQDAPDFPNWDQDATAVAQRYGEQSPDVVADELAAAAESVAAAFDAVPDEAWTRTGRRSDGSTFTVATLGQYFVHDPEHHVHDVTGDTVWAAQ